MNYRHRLKYLLVKKLGISNKEAEQLIGSGAIQVNGKPVTDNCIIGPYDTVTNDQLKLLPEKEFRYYLYNKPRGIECTLNPSIPESLSNSLPANYEGLFYAGRLDKDSEGLLFLTDDGYVINKLIKPEKDVPKYYKVETEGLLTEQLLTALEKGILLDGKMTKPAIVKQTGPRTFELTLTEGRYRQIRRMVFSLGNYVTRLKRIGFGMLKLGKLGPGELRELSNEEVIFVRKN